MCALYTPSQNRVHTCATRELVSTDQPPPGTHPRASGGFPETHRTKVEPNTCRQHMRQSDDRCTFFQKAFGFLESSSMGFWRERFEIFRVSLQAKQRWRRVISFLIVKTSPFQSLTFFPRDTCFNPIPKPSSLVSWSQICLLNFIAAFETVRFINKKMQRSN